MFYQNVYIACMFNEIHDLPCFPENKTHFFLGNVKQNILLFLMFQVGISIAFKATEAAEIPMFAAGKETKLSCMLHQVLH